MALRWIDYQSQLRHILKERGFANPRIDSFIAHLQSLAGDADLPCPECFIDDRKGTLHEQTLVGGILVLRCDTCSDQVLVRVQ